MRLGFKALLVALLALLAPLSAARAEWLEGTSPNFTFYGDMNEAEMQRYAERLEAFHGALRLITRASEPSRVTMYILPDLAEVQRLFGPNGRNIGGFYIPSNQGAMAFMPRRIQWGGANTVLFHEYAHHMLLSNVDQFLPGWASEGLAELFSTVRFAEDGTLTFGAPNADRGASVNAMDRMSIEELLTSDSRNLGDRRHQIYSRGWLLVHYLLLSGNRPGQFSRYIELINQGIPTMGAARQAFGELGRLDREFDVYRRAPRFNGFNVTRAQLGPPPRLTIRRLRPGEAAIMPYRIRSARGVDARIAASLVEPARRVAAQYPDDPFVYRTLAEIEYDARNLAQAEAAADRALQLDPQNVMAMAYKARVAGRRAAATPNNAAAWRDVRALIRRAIRTDPNNALALVLYYDSFVAAGERVPDDAMRGLLRAIVLVPQDSSSRIRLGYAQLRAGDAAGARHSLLTVGYNSHLPPTNPARRIVERIAAGDTAQAVLPIATEAGWDRLNEYAAPRGEGEQQGS